MIKKTLGFVSSSEKSLVHIVDINYVSIFPFLHLLFLHPWDPMFSLVRQLIFIGRNGSNLTSYILVHLDQVLEVAFFTLLNSEFTVPWWLAAFRWMYWSFLLLTHSKFVVQFLVARLPVLLNLLVLDLVLHDWPTWQFLLLTLIIPAAPVGLVRHSFSFKWSYLIMTAFDGWLCQLINRFCCWSKSSLLETVEIELVSSFSDAGYTHWLAPWLNYCGVHDWCDVEEAPFQIIFNNTTFLEYNFVVVEDVILYLIKRFTKMNSFLNKPTIK